MKLFYRIDITWKVKIDTWGSPTTRKIKFRQRFTSIMIFLGYLCLKKLGSFALGTYKTMSTVRVFITCYYKDRFPNSSFSKKKIFVFQNHDFFKLKNYCTKKCKVIISSTNQPVSNSNKLDLIVL